MGRDYLDFDANSVRSGSKSSKGKVKISTRKGRKRNEASLMKDESKSSIEGSGIGGGLESNLL